MAAVLSGVEAGEWLIDNLAEAERREAAWLQVLAQFDLDQGWAADGQLSGAEWLMWKAGMARATAYEKLQVAHQLRRRPYPRTQRRQGERLLAAPRQRRG